MYQKTGKRCTALIIILLMLSAMVPMVSAASSAAGGWVNSNNTIDGFNYDASKSASNPSVARLDGSWYAAWQENDKIRVAKQSSTDGSWSLIDGNSDGGINYNSGKAAANPELTVYNGNLYAVWEEECNVSLSNTYIQRQLRMAKYTGSSWEFVDSADVNGITAFFASDYNTSSANYHYACYSSVTADPSGIYVSWVERYSSSVGEKKLHVAKYDGTSWSIIGGTSSTSGLNYNSEKDASYPSITTDGAGHCYVAWTETAGAACSVHVTYYDGSAWTDLSGSGLNYDIAKYINNPAKIAIYSGEPYVAWDETDSNSVNQVRLKKYSGGSWTFVDGGGSTGLNYDTTKGGYGVTLVADTSNLYLGWIESSNTVSQFRVKSYNPTDGWMDMDSDGIRTGGDAAGVNMDVAHSVSFGETLGVGNGKLCAVFGEYDPTDAISQIQFKEYDATFTLAANADQIANIVPTNGTLYPSVTTDVYEYTILEDQDTTSETITLTLADTNATFVYEGVSYQSGDSITMDSLQTGDNTLLIKLVTQKASVVKHISIRINRAVSSTQRMISPIADSYYDGYGTYPYGDTYSYSGEAVNWVGYYDSSSGSASSALKFDYGFIPSDVTAAEFGVKINSITDLRSTEDPYVSLYGSNDTSWTRTSSSVPSKDVTIATQSSITVDTYKTFDVSSYMNGLSGTTATFVMDGNGAGDGTECDFSYYSEENSIDKPYLLVTYVSNSAPTASAVTITGQALVGQTLSGSYTYADVESETEGTSLFKWYSADDNTGTNKVTAATTKDYTVTSADIGKYLCFEVTPVASAGTTTGTAVTSSYTGVVTSTPTVTTAAVSGSSSTGATLNGTINANAANTTVTFEYGTTISYGTTVIADPSSVTGTSSTSVSAILSGLSQSTTYHYRVVGENSVGTTNGDNMTFTTAGPPPSITNLSPDAGPTLGGTTVTITGTNLNGTTEVRFGSTSASTFSVDSDTQITATVPASSEGIVDVMVTTADGTSTYSGFTYVAAPTVTAISPTSGSVGGTTAVVITGTNLSGATAVKFGSINAESFTIDSNSQITAVAPTSTVAKVHITVSTVGGTSATSNNDQFTFTGEITGFDSISNIDAGYAGNTTYADAAEVIGDLPSSVTVNGEAFSVPVISWDDTDGYDPDTAGSYTFTATLGTLPTGYTNTGGYTATVEVIVKPNTEITSFDEIDAIIAGLPGSSTYANADEVKGILPTNVTANDGAVTVGVTEWVDTDSYDPDSEGSYTFTAILDTLPTGYENTDGHTATVKVIISSYTQITGFDNISSINAGKAGAATYEDTEDVIAVLPTTVTANDGTVSVLVTNWNDTDDYDPTIAGTYTFTATIGGLPTGYANDGNFKATVEIIVSAKTEIAGFDTISNISAGEEGSATYADAAAVIAVLPTTVMANSGSVSISVASWTDTDTYNPSAAGSYTFTASIGTLPTGYVNTSVHTATIEVVVSAKSSSGGSGGGGSSSSSNRTISSTTSTVIEVNGKSQSAGTSTETTTGGQTVTTVTVDTTKLEKILETQGKNATVTIPVTTNSDVAAGVLTGQMVKNMEEKEATLEVKTNSAIYTLPASQINIDAVSEQLGKSVTLSDIKVTVAIAEPSAEQTKVVANAAKEGEFSIVVPAIDFSIDCTYNGKTVDVSNFNAYVERTIAIPDGVDPTKITTGVVVSPDGKVRQVPTQIIQINGKYYAKINSLTNSTYAVIWNPITFADVANHWAKDAVNNMGSRMIVTGVGNGNYNPNKDITRAEFAAIVVRALGLEAGTGENKFSDVKAANWFCGYVETASKFGIINGYNETTFAPNDKITREQAMAMISRAMKITGIEPTLTDSEMSTLLAGYMDATGAASYAKSSIATCLKTGVVSGTSSNTLAPKNNITRAEVAVIVERLLKKSELI